MRESQTAIGSADRRVHPRVREIFEDAVECVRPFFARSSL
jgi:hypothetical protein